MGWHYPNSPRASNSEASKRYCRVVLAEDAISNLDDRGRQEMRDMGIALMPADEVGAALESAADEPS